MLSMSEKSQAIGKDLKSQENVWEFKIQGCDSLQKYTPLQEKGLLPERTIHAKKNIFKIEGWRQGELLKENLFPGVR